MSRRILQTGFGLVVGVAVRVLLPGHPAMGMLATAGLSLAGAFVAELAAERFLPADVGPRAGFVASAIGAMAVLLAYGIAVKQF
jgi:uncharacterized membrane protein YeaQ/YmgE (transglycosylase-associated protein family)